MRSYKFRLDRLMGDAQKLQAQLLIHEFFGESFGSCVLFTSPREHPNRYIARNGRVYTQAELDDAEAALKAAGVEDLHFIFLGTSTFDPTLPTRPEDDGNVR